MVRPLEPLIINCYSTIDDLVMITVDRVKAYKLDVNLFAEKEIP